MIIEREQENEHYKELMMMTTCLGLKEATKTNNEKTSNRNNSTDIELTT